MSFHRAAMPIRRVSNDCSSSPNAYLLSCNNSGGEDFNFICTGVCMWPQDWKIDPSQTKAGQKTDPSTDYLQ